MSDDKAMTDKTANPMTAWRRAKAGANGSERRTITVHLDARVGRQLEAFIKLSGLTGERLTITDVVGDALQAYIQDSSSALVARAVAKQGGREMNQINDTALNDALQAGARAGLLADMQRAPSKILLNHYGGAVSVYWTTADNVVRHARTGTTGRGNWSLVVAAEHALSAVQDALADTHDGYSTPYTTPGGVA